MLSMLLLLMLFTDSFSKILDTLIIEGLSINRPPTVHNNITLRKGLPFTPIDVQKAMKSLYRSGLFKDVEFHIVAETDTSASLLLKLIENKICESIEFTGQKKLKRKELEEKITIQKGQVISDALIHENIILIKHAYSSEGFLLADITCELIETKVPGNIIVKFTIEEGKKVRVRGITFHGNTAIKTKKLKRKLKTKQKRFFSSGEFKKDLYQSHLDSLMLYYYDQGYLDARIVRDSIWYAKNMRDIFIDIELQEGKRYYTGDFFFTGNKVLEKQALASRVAMKKGKPFNRTKFEMTKMYISNAYREEGYLWIQVQEQNEYRGDTIDVTFSIVEGRPAIVRKVDITGNDKTREKVIRRELRVYPGQKYKQSRMERSIREIMQLNYFDNVSPDLRPNDDGTIDLVYTVQEKENIGQFSAGVMYSQVDKIGGNFSIVIPNFRGAGQQLDAEVEYSKYRKRYSVGFREPWIFDTPTSFSIRGFYQKYENPYYKFSPDPDNPNKKVSYEYYSQGIEIGSGRRLKWPDDYFSAFVEYRISYEKDNRDYEDDIGGFTLVRNGLLSKLSLIIKRNDTDIPTFPNRGSILSITTSLAGLGGDFRFAKGIIGYDWYFPLFWKFVLGMKSKFGLVGAVGEKKKLAHSDLFAAGGVYYEGQIRGYSEGAFGRWSNHGLSLLTFSGEIRFPILEQQLYLAAFGDMGNVWDDVADIDVTDMYPGVGFGFRLMLPMIGLIGFDFAWGLKDPTDPHFGGDPSGFIPHFLMNRGF